MSHRHSSGPGTAMAARMLNIGLSMCLQEGAGEAGGRREHQHLGQGVPSKVICKVTCKVPVERQVLGFPLKGAVPSAQDTEEMLNFLAG